MKIYLPGSSRGFIRRHCLQSMFEQGHEEALLPNRADAIIHVVGPSRPHDFIDGKVAVGGLFTQFINILELNQEKRAPFVLLSSLDVAHNNNPYTALKLAQESALEAYGTLFKFDTHVIRTSCVFGPGMDERRFIPLAARQIQGGYPVSIHAAGDLISRRTWTWAPALADMLVMAAVKGNRPAKYFNWMLSADTMAKAVGTALGRSSISIRFTQFYEDNPGHYVKDEESVLECADIPIDLNVALRRTLYDLGYI